MIQQTFAKIGLLEFMSFSLTDVSCCLEMKQTEFLLLPESSHLFEMGNSHHNRNSNARVTPDWSSMDATTGNLTRIG